MRLSVLMVSGIVRISLYPLAEAMYARPTPVLPLVASTYTHTKPLENIQHLQEFHARRYCKLPGLFCQGLYSLALLLC